MLEKLYAIIASIEDAVVFEIVLNIICQGRYSLARHIAKGDKVVVWIEMRRPLKRWGERLNVIFENKKIKAFTTQTVVNGCVEITAQKAEKRWYLIDDKLFLSEGGKDDDRVASHFFKDKDSQKELFWQVLKA